jgi:hypothetical protein
MGGSVAGSAAFDRFAGWLSILAGVAGIGYALAFVVLKNAQLQGIFLTLAPLFATAGLVAIFQRVREVDSGFATLALALGAYGSLAASTHGAFDLANVLHPPETTLVGLPNFTDPRGYGTFGLTGFALLILARLSARTADVPGWVSPVGLALGIFLVVTWLGRLIVLDPNSVLVLVPALASGLLSPILYLGLGAWLLGWRR